MDKKVEAIDRTVSAIQSREKDIKELKKQLEDLTKAQIYLSARGMMRLFIDGECTHQAGSFEDIMFQSCYYADEVDVNNFAIAIQSLYDLEYRPIIHIVEV
ncbi:hypothetical protein D3C86_1722450 [compost metagenome]